MAEIPSPVPGVSASGSRGDVQAVAPASQSIDPLLGQVIEGDNLEFMRGLADEQLDLIYADPPFFTGKTFNTPSARPRARRKTAPTTRTPVAPSRDHQLLLFTEPSGGVGFADSWQGGLDSYLAFLRPRVEEMRRLLKPTGTLYLHLDWHAVHYAKVMLDEVFGYDNLLNEIIWSYRTGGLSRRWFARKHDTLLVYARRCGRQKFHVQRGGAFRTDGLNHDEHGRPYKNTRSGRLYFHPDGPTMTDVWEIPFLSTVSRERVGYPTQKPEALLERILQASTDPGDVVADFFCGSGTTLAVAAKLGRKWMGCDSSKEAVRIARQRLS